MTDSEKDEEQSDWLLDDEPHEKVAAVSNRSWKVLIVDDEPDVHSVTRLALRGIEYKGSAVELLSAHSAEEGFRILSSDRDIALVLLDVVMETEVAGLHLVRRIRETLGNHLVRIVLRTGQPGHAPERDVVIAYDINDYKAKTELTTQKLFTTVISSLRAYDSLLTIERSRQGLNKILEGSTNLYQLHSLRDFSSGVLNQIGAILGFGTQGILCARGLRGAPDAVQILGTTGVFSELEQNDSFRPGHEAYDEIDRAITSQSSISDHCIYFKARGNREFVIYFVPPWSLQPVERELLEVFCSRISAAFDNLYYHEQMLRAQEATVVALADLAEYRDTDTGEHVLRVRRLTEGIADKLLARGYFAEQLTPRFMEMVGMASILHDVGKVATPDNILFKPGVHTPDERVIMKQHSPIGAQIVRKSADMVEGMSYLSIGAEIAGGHHEQYDGSGYPNGLSGEQIPLSARIVAVVDVYDALIHKRCYKEPWPLQQALDYIKQRSGKQFDPKVVEAFLDFIADEQKASAPSPD
jgi:response regulator RpfG family c-di-GMP phosphodiesterase